MREGRWTGQASLLILFTRPSPFPSLVTLPSLLTVTRERSALACDSGSALAGAALAYGEEETNDE